MATETIPDYVTQKQNALKDILRDYGAIAIAYSGGVDSTYLSDVAHEVLGPKARMILADSPSIPRAEVAAATAIAANRGWKLTVLQTQEFQNEDFLKNDGTRCYFCKSELFSQMDTFAKDNHIPVLAYGELAED